MFNAFISYSHAADEILSRSLQNALQKFAKPWYKKRNLEIFRDESSLSASPHLWHNIKEAMDASEYFILLASPHSEKSHWVNKEVEYWLKNKSLDTVLIALTEGEIDWNVERKCFQNPDSNSLPPILDEQFNEEPFYVDLRQSRTEEDLSLDNSIFKKEILRLASKLHGKRPNDLASEELSVHRKMIRLRNSAVVTLCILFLGTLVACGFLIEADIKDRNQARLVIDANRKNLMKFDNIREYVSEMNSLNWYEKKEGIARELDSLIRIRTRRERDSIQSLK